MARTSQQDSQIEKLQHELEESTKYQQNVAKQLEAAKAKKNAERKRTEDQAQQPKANPKGKGKASETEKKQAPKNKRKRTASPDSSIPASKIARTKTTTTPRTATASTSASTSAAASASAGPAAKLATSSEIAQLVDSIVSKSSIPVQLALAKVSDAFKDYVSASAKYRNDVDESHEEIRSIISDFTTELTNLQREFQEYIEANPAPALESSATSITSWAKNTSAASETDESDDHGEHSKTATEVPNSSRIPIVDSIANQVEGFDSSAQPSSAQPSSAATPASEQASPVSPVVSIL